MDDSYRLTLEETPDANDLNFVRERLNEFNRLHVEDDHHKLLTIFLRDHQGTIVAGLVGATYWGWLHVELLWVDKEGFSNPGFCGTIIPGTPSFC